MNAFLKNILINKIKKALIDSQTAKGINHSALVGRYREILLDSLIKPLLNNKYLTASGCKIVDYKGDISNEIDICIYSQNLLPPFFFTTNKEGGIYPIESVLKCIEVKTTFTKSNLESTYKKFKLLEDKLISTSGMHDKFGQPIPHVHIQHGYSLFAYTYSSTRYTPETILNTYKNIDPEWNTNPLIRNICIANNGWVIFSEQGWYHMSYDSENSVNEEIIGFLCSLVQELPDAESFRGEPRIGHYLFNPNEMDRIINGKRTDNPWKGHLIKFIRNPIN